MAINITNLPYDILSHIVTFITDKEAERFVTSCSKLNTFGKKQGYLREIKFDCGTDPIQFSIASYIHHKTLEKVIINGILDDPELWCYWLNKRKFEEKEKEKNLKKPLKRKKNIL